MARTSLPRFRLRRVLMELGINCVSPIAATDPSLETQIPGRLYRSAREELPSLGGPPLQPAQPRSTPHSPPFRSYTPINQNDDHKWPPPPRQMPIIVPSHLTSTTDPPPEAATGRAGASGKSKKSSLHRAVMERLEVQKAMSDLAGAGRGD
jgi:hypothetical protein